MVATARNTRSLRSKSSKYPSVVVCDKGAGKGNLHIIDPRGDQALVPFKRSRVVSFRSLELKRMGLDKDVDMEG